MRNWPIKRISVSFIAVVSFFTSVILVNGADFIPGFPISGLAPFSPAIINSVSDRTISTGAYNPDGFVRAYSGETGERSFGASDGCYKKDVAGSSFVLSGGNYRGAAGTSFLCYDGHPGVDFKVTGANIIAADAGVVIELRNDRPDEPDLECACFGNYIRIDHENGFISTYGHLKKGSITKSLGARVVRGELVGISGNSGVSSGPHLHFELRRRTSDGGTVIVDPYSLWLPEQITGSFDGVVWLIQDTGGFLSGTGIRVLDQVTGTFSYDRAVTDQNPDPSRGLYSFRTPPSSFIINVGPYLFTHDFNATTGLGVPGAITVSVLNDFPSPPQDNFLIYGTGGTETWPLIPLGIQFLALFESYVIGSFFPCKKETDCFHLCVANPKRGEQSVGQDHGGPMLGF